MESIHPRDHHVFFGGLDSSKLSLAHRMIRKLPAARAILSEGDFRNWKDIEVWAMNIARALEALQTPQRNAPIMIMGAK
jgi:menaquinone-dependent protoporphyrinogen oxidase